MYYVATTRVPRQQYLSDPALQGKVHKTIEKLHNLALDVGLDPDLNVTLVEAGDEIRIGISEEMDLFLREAPGAWQYY